MADDQDQGSGTDRGDDADQNDLQGGDGGGSSGNQNGGSGDSGNQNDGNSDETVSKSDFDKLFARMQAADRAKNAAEQKLKEKEQAEMGELDRAKAVAEEATKRADEAEGKLKAMVIENAFHRENKFDFHDVSDAVAALDLSTVEIGDDGKVKGMAAAIKEMVKRKPHYVKSKREEDEGEGDDPPAANGAQNGRRKGQQSETFDAKKMAQRFPALSK
jgi:hypothetical protein